MGAGQFCLMRGWKIVTDIKLLGKVRWMGMDNSTEHSRYVHSLANDRGERNLCSERADTGREREVEREEEGEGPGRRDQGDAGLRSYTALNTQ